MVNKNVRRSKTYPSAQVTEVPARIITVQMQSLWATSERFISSTG